MRYMLVYIMDNSRHSYLDKVAFLQCNPRHIYKGVSPNENVRTDFWVNTWEVQFFVWLLTRTTEFNGTSSLLSMHRASALGLHCNGSVQGKPNKFLLDKWKFLLDKWNSSRGYRHSQKWQWNVAQKWQSKQIAFQRLFLRTSIYRGGKCNAQWWHF